MANTPSVNKQNVIVGAASLYLGNAAAYTKPAYVNGASYRTTLEGTAWNPAATDPTTAAFWTGAGYTQEGLEVSYEPEYGDTEVDQVLDSVLTFKQSMRVTLNTTLAEATLFNLMVSWGQPSSTLVSTASDAEITIAGGSLGDAPTERSLIAVGNGVYARASQANSTQYGERVYHIYRALQTESSAHALRRNENTGIPCAFRALPDDFGNYGKVKDRQRTW